MRKHFKFSWLIFLELGAAIMVFLLGLVIVPVLVAIDVFKWLRKEFNV